MGYKLNDCDVLMTFSLVAAHPQVRRKLDDVAHKLNILYDKLRAQTLSPATLQGLHSILQHIWQYDYPSCMQVVPDSFLTLFNVNILGHRWPDCRRVLRRDV